MQKLIKVAEQQIEILDNTIENNNLTTEEIVAVSNQINRWILTIMECKKVESTNKNVEENQQKISEISNKLSNSLNKILQNKSII